MTKQNHKGWRSILGWVRNMFLAGLAVAVPLILTIWIVGVVAKFVEMASEPLFRFLAFWANVFTGREGADRIASEDFHVPLPFDVNLVGLLVPVLLIIALGAMATNVIGRRVVAWFDRVVANIPVVNFIYNGLKQVIDSFRNFGQTQNFKRVAYVDYPSPGCRLIGFVTGQYQDPVRGKGVTSVFIPTSPNPMTGFVVVVDDERVTDSRMSLEDAMKLILSAGLVAPAIGSGTRRLAGDPPPGAAPHPILPPGLPIAEDGMEQAAAAGSAPGRADERYEVASGKAGGIDGAPPTDTPSEPRPSAPHRTPDDGRRSVTTAK